VRVEAVAALLPGILEEDQALLLAQSREHRESRTVELTPVAAAAAAARRVGAHALGRAGS
jgi:prolyl-tRNA synthetase